MKVVERSAELRGLHESLTADRAGAGRVVVIEGAGGSGKTSLLHAFGTQVMESGGTFLCASASRAERDLPLSAVGQMFYDPVLPAADIERADRLLGDGFLAAMASGDEPSDPHDPHDADAVAQVPGPVLGRLTSILLALAERGPLVIAVDDVHHADAASLRFLLYLARRLRSAGVLLVLTECPRPSPVRSLPYADLVREPHCRRLRLRPFTLHGVATVLAELLGPRPAQRLAAECHRVSGGNPLLVRALAEDLQSARGGAPAEPVFGDAFRQAVLTCLYRAGAMTLAQGIAVLGADATDRLLGELLHSDTESIGLMRRPVRGTGLVGDRGFRHDAIRAAVLGALSPAKRRELHLRAARLLYQHGGDVTVVADHLVAADQAPAGWATRVLREAAEVAQGPSGQQGEQKAIGHLRLAVRECADHELRPALLLDLARAEWRIDPATAARHLPELARDLREGRLPPDGEATLVGWLLWLGRLDDALAILAPADGPPHPDGAPQADGPPRWLRYVFPELSRHKALRDGTRLPEPRPGRPVAAAEHPAAAAVLQVEAMLAGVLGNGTLANGALGYGPLGNGAHGKAVYGTGAHRTDLLGTEAPGKAVRGWDVLGNGAQDGAVALAEQILQEAGPAARTLTPIVAIAALVYADDLDRAGRWCATFADAASGWPQGGALLAAVRGLIHQRRGELTAAVACARTSLELMSPRGWGIVIGIPLATALLALTAAGRYEEAERFLDVPVPEAMLDSPLGLPYLQARGYYHLAINRPQAALTDFRTCGELAAAWGFDAPGFVAWRTDLAQAHLALGEWQDARRLAAGQLRILPPGRARTRGMTLRILAAASRVQQSTEPLTEAVALLERSGDQLELARALTELGRLYHRAGQTRRALAAEKRARWLAAKCGAEDILDTAPERPAEMEQSSERLVADPLTGLSDAERRVAALAADGYTNRQIARTLHVTTSTVEQHLTRVYRKLQIKRRVDLPLTLLLPPENSPA